MPSPSPTRSWAGLMLLSELSLVYNWILAPEPILETAGGSGRGRRVIHPEPFLGTLRVSTVFWR